MKLRLFTFFIIALLFAQLSSASVPQEWAGNIKNDINLYQISIKFIHEDWTKNNIEYLVSKYTNRYRVSDVSINELHMKMNWYIKQFNVQESQLISYCDDCWGVK